jgi:hypothetical protein
MKKFRSVDNGYVDPIQHTLEVLKKYPFPIEEGKLNKKKGQTMSFAVFPILREEMLTKDTYKILINAIIKFNDIIKELAKEL